MRRPHHHHPHPERHPRLRVLRHVRHLVPRPARLATTLRNTHDPGVYVDWETLSLTYPQLPYDTLRKWVTRGHVSTLPGGHYQIAAINTRMKGNEQ